MRYLLGLCLLLVGCSDSKMNKCYRHVDDTIYAKVVGIESLNNGDTKLHYIAADTSSYDPSVTKTNRYDTNDYEGFGSRYKQQVSCSQYEDALAKAEMYIAINKKFDRLSETISDLQEQVYKLKK